MPFTIYPIKGYVKDEESNNYIGFNAMSDATADDIKDDVIDLITKDYQNLARGIHKDEYGLYIDLDEIR